MPQRILTDDWSWYDQRKKPEDRLFFSFDQEWETEYLLEKIRKFEPGITAGAIRFALHLAKKDVPAPHPREKIVQCLMEKL